MYTWNETLNCHFKPDLIELNVIQKQVNKIMIYANYWTDGVTICQHLFKNRNNIFIKKKKRNFVSIFFSPAVNWKCSFTVPSGTHIYTFEWCVRECTQTQVIIFNIFNIIYLLRGWEIIIYMVKYFDIQRQNQNVFKNRKII